ncbi:hypothetical protein HFP57_02980 [Parasphingopyxis algicola]|uniref:hypothetical protein n=1 Tax=Parasphingopyxis algicola TaxID=2026624 RepID=UPI0015A4CF64|nr:hypothetical protein [Parasphingopyxis algicola]QLC24095.1 hypothetical protein HFP57_02980 [Parasphingopyxis algicola]
MIMGTASPRQLWNGSIGIGAAAMLALSVQAEARTEIAPYIEVQQILDFDLSNNDALGDDVVTYTSVAAGVDASVATRRIEVGASYRYERRIDWGDDIADDDVHSGLVRARANITRGLSLEAGALAARARAEIGGDGLGSLTGDNDNSTQIYSIYGGPTLSTHAGPLEIGAGYRIGYTHVEDNFAANSDPTQAPVDYVDHTTYHLATASVGMSPGGMLPFGWIVSGGYEREDASQLDQRYEAYYGRVDVTVPVTPTLALVGGVGYEDIEISQRDVIVDATGNPVLDNNGRFQTDPNSPRLLAYNVDEVIYDAGILWRPNPRLELSARVGHRYDTTIYNGYLTYQASSSSTLQAAVYNEIGSFGRGTTNTLAGLPTSFTLGRNGFNQFNGCAFGDDGSAGGCFDNGFQSLNAANFRSRGGNLVWTGGRGPWSYGVGAGYQNRRYFAPTTSANFSLDRVTDEAFALQANLGRQLSPNSSLDGNLYATWFESGIPGEADVFSSGGSATYSVGLYSGLSAQASAGLFANDVEGEETDWLATLLFGVRYGF